MKTIVALAVTAVALAGCSSSGNAQQVTVFAAASLTSAFTTLGQQFESAHPGVTVRFSFAGSSDLATQISQGAPADVFASADVKNMTRVAAQGAAAPVNFATNTLEIAVAPDNPRQITSFADLAKPGVKTVVCAPQVPCGAATQQVETATSTNLTPVSEEASVTDVLSKVTSGEADAGVVYVTDVRTAGSKVTGVPFPQSSAAANTYPVVALRSAANPQLATQFLALVTGAEGRKVLADAGFAAP